MNEENIFIKYEGGSLKVGKLEHEIGTERLVAEYPDPISPRATGVEYRSFNVTQQGADLSKILGVFNMEGVGFRTWGGLKPNTPPYILNTPDKNPYEYSVMNGHIHAYLNSVTNQASIAFKYSGKDSSIGLRKEIPLSIGTKGKLGTTDYQFLNLGTYWNYHFEPSEGDILDGGYHFTRYYLMDVTGWWFYNGKRVVSEWSPFRGLGVLAYASEYTRNPILTATRWNYTLVNGNKTLEEFFREHFFTSSPEPGGSTDPDPGPGGSGEGDGDTDSQTPTGGDEDKNKIDDEPVDFTPPPTVSLVASGMASVYNPTAAELGQLASYLYSDASEWFTAIKKFLVNPMDVIIGLGYIPIKPVNESSKSDIMLGWISSGVQAYKVANQYRVLNCGTITVKQRYGNALDFEPFTKLTLYLPYIGLRNISTNDVMGKDMEIQYNIDVVSGALVAMVKCGGTVLYEFSGDCYSALPVSGTNYDEMIRSTIQMAASMASMGVAVAAGGSAMSIGSAGVGVGVNATNTALAAKPTFQRNGNNIGPVGLLGSQVPYLIREYPRTAIPANIKKYIGYPSSKTLKLSETSGFTKVLSIHLDNIRATTPELDEIYTLLREGVIF